ncbi:elongation of very long chain fatty acids protein 7-like [Oppia nitens]|uniref:elongation of very long chain fatty acids protein 7-like n=1 Tax=Oppia nitens TaxID=1686743 RepID=UPI0023DB0E9B|nr:elongation of very long chain fatty acids protein 7-like [Oppia nitens]
MNIIADYIPVSSVSPQYLLHDFWELEGDPRIGNHPFFRGGPWTTWSLIAFYIYFVKDLGPKLMKNVRPFGLRRLMLIYNLSMIWVNAWFFYQIVWIHNFGRDLRLYEFERPDSRDTSPQTMKIISLAYLFFLSKLVDLIETVFFVLRKKHNQISNLHVYHHSIVPVLAHLSIKVSPFGGPATLFPLLNTLVHIVMYTYYALSALGPSVQKYLWWKRYITQIQLIQFIIFSIYSIFFFVYQRGYPKIFPYLGLCQPPLFFYMFWSFYRQSYVRKSKSQ